MISGQFYQPPTDPHPSNLNFTYQKPASFSVFTTRRQLPNQIQNFTWHIRFLIKDDVRVHLKIIQRGRSGKPSLDLSTLKIRRQPWIPHPPLPVFQSSRYSTSLFFSHKIRYFLSVSPPSSSVVRSDNYFKPSIRPCRFLGIGYRRRGRRGNDMFFSFYISWFFSVVCGAIWFFYKVELKHFYTLICRMYWCLGFVALILFSFFADFIDEEKMMETRFHCIILCLWSTWCLGFFWGKKGWGMKKVNFWKLFLVFVELGDPNFWSLIGFRHLDALRNKWDSRVMQNYTCTMETPCLTGLLLFVDKLFNDIKIKELLC